MLNTKQVAEIVGCTTATIRSRLTPACIEKSQGGFHRKAFYTKKQAQEFATKYQAERAAYYARVERNKELRRQRLERVKPKLQFKGQYRGRECPRCGAPVVTGQYICAECRAADTTDYGRCDDGYVYGVGI